MIEIRDFTSAVNQISEEKGISAEKVLETIEQAIAAAYKKDYGKKGQIIKAKLDAQSGEVKFWQVKIVVDQDSLYSEEELEGLKDRKEDDEEETDGKKVKFNPEKHIMIDEAQKIDEKIKVGDELETFLESKKDYGRIAAQTAKQVIMQKLREAERESVFGEYKDKEGEILSGIVQRIEGRNIFLDIGKTLGVLAKEEQVPGEFYRPGQRLKVFVVQVEDTPRGPRVFLSRAYPKLISKLFELEVPEIASNQVEIKAIAREAGSRTKIAVASNAEGIDPIGAAVGQRGTRVQAIINELGGEKIDIIEWSDDPAKFIANSLSPAKVLEVELMPKNKVLCIVPEDQLSLAIGKDGQNVRLAAKLTGWKIDVRGKEEKQEGLPEEIEEPEKEVETKEAEEAKPIEAPEKKEKAKKATKTKKSKEKKIKE
jgi:N utilization substance protein A